MSTTTVHQSCLILYITSILMMMMMMSWHSLNEKQSNTTGEPSSVHGISIRADKNGEYNSMNNACIETITLIMLMYMLIVSNWRKTILFIFCIMVGSTKSCWVQLGQDINGEND
eukprot:194609_1